MFGIRVKNQNTLVVNLPRALAQGSEVSLTITYAGRLEPQTPDREALAMLDVEQGRATDDQQPLMMAAEPSYLYSSRSFWYPQAAVTDYATARLRISVPPSLDVVASGELEAGFPGLLVGKEPALNRKVYVFNADAAAALPRVHHEPLLAGRNRDDRISGDGRAGDQGQDLSIVESVRRSEPAATAAGP